LKGRSAIVVVLAATSKVTAGKGGTGLAENGHGARARLGGCPSSLAGNWRRETNSRRPAKGGPVGADAHALSPRQAGLPRPPGQSGDDVCQWGGPRGRGTQGPRPTW